MFKIFYFKILSFSLILILLIIPKSSAEIIKTTCKSILNDRLIGVRSFILNTDLKINEQKDDGFKIVVGVIKNNDIIKWNYFEYKPMFGGGDYTLFSYDINQKTGKGYSRVAVLTNKEKIRFQENKLFSQPNYFKDKLQTTCD
jgi:hypothetical protein